LKRLKSKDARLRRTNKLSLLLNNREMRALEAYCLRYRIKNRSQFLREVILSNVLKRFDDDYPTLWQDSEPDLFNQHHHAAEPVPEYKEQKLHLRLGKSRSA
jgi:hypothetical protein